MAKRQRLFTAETPSDKLESSHQLGDLEQFGVSPRLVSILDRWHELPPHVQETMTLLSELGSPRTYGSKTPAFETPANARCIKGRLCLLQREIIHALRHSPERHDLVMDNQGWVSVEGVVALSQKTIGYVTKANIAEIIRPLGDRIELDDNRIRATYGHSTSCFAPQSPSVPDVPLFHGTLHESWPMIELFGLQPMKRRFVQLTTDYEYASEHLSNKCSDALILQVVNKEAMDAGVLFFDTGTHVWLASHIPSSCLQLWSEPTTASKPGLFDKDARDEQCI